MRRIGGRETWHRLREWDRGQAESERLAARLLQTEGYEAMDPSHPLGGPDGGKDAMCRRVDGKRYVLAVHFPRGQSTGREIQAKFENDIAKAKANEEAGGFVFFTNQELTLGEREALEQVGVPLGVDIYHLERIASILDTPRGYGLRLEYLSIEMTKEEQLSYFSERDKVLYEIRDRLAAQDASKRLAEQAAKLGGGIRTVSVEQHAPDPYGYQGIFGSRLLACRGCGEVFRAMRSSSTCGIFIDALETVTCPACGKVQAFKAFP